MAAQTITTDANHDDLTGRLGGDPIIITEFATLTIDSEPQRTPMGNLGHITVTAGELLIDARGVRHLDYTGGSGTLTQGTTITGNVTGATATFMRDLTGTLKLKNVVGSFADTEGLTAGSGWTGTASGTERLGTLEVLFQEGKNTNPSRQGTVTYKGEWIEIGTSNGTANQTVQFWNSNFCSAVWIETGAGTGVYEKWMNYNRSMTNNVKAGQFGNFYSQVHGNATLTFGNGTWGNIPPNGAKIRVPNLYISQSTSVAPTVATMPSGLGSYYRITGNAGAYNIDKVNLISYWVSSNMANIDVSNSSIAHTVLISEAFAPFTFRNCAFVRPYTLVNTNNLLNGILSPSTNIVDDCVFYAEGIGASNLQAIVFSSNTPVQFTNCTAILDSSTNTNDRLITLTTNCDNSLFSNCKLIGYSLIVSTANVRLENITLGVNLNGTDNPGATDHFNISNMVNLEVDNMTIDPSYGLYTTTTSNIITCSTSTKVTFSNFGSLDNPVVTTGMTNSINLTSGCTDVVIANCHFTERIGTFNNSSTRVLIQNCSQTGLDLLNNSSVNSVVLSYRGTGDIGANNGVETDYTSVYDNNYYTTFKSDTEGLVSIIMNEKSNNPTLYTILSGNNKEIYFNSLGDLSITGLNNEIEFLIESPIADNNKILGFTSFQNVDPQIVRQNTIPVTPGNLEYSYDIDTGSGFSGTFKSLTGSNLSGETITPDGGFRLKVRVKCIVASTSTTTNLINGIGILMNTTLPAQRDNLYSIRPVVANYTLQLPNILEGSRYRIYNVNQSRELANTITPLGGINITLIAGLDYNPGDQIDLTVAYTNGLISKKEYENSFTMPAVSTTNTLPFTQIDDDVYINNGVDGSLITKFVADYDDNEIDLVVSENFQAKEAYAFWKYNLTTIQGIRQFWGGVTAIDIANYRINTNILNLKFDITTADNIFQEDTARIFRDDGAYPVKTPTTGGGAIDIVWKEKTLIATFQGETVNANITKVNDVAVTIDDFKTSPTEVWSQDISAINTGASQTLKETKTNAQVSATDPSWRGL